MKPAKNDEKKHSGISRQTRNRVLSLPAFQKYAGNVSQDNINEQILTWILTLPECDYGSTNGCQKILEGRCPTRTTEGVEKVQKDKFCTYVPRLHTNNQGINLKNSISASSMIGRNLTQGTAHQLM
jgi:hypothetical protein